MEINNQARQQVGGSIIKVFAIGPNQKSLNCLGHIIIICGIGHAHFCLYFPYTEKLAKLFLASILRFKVHLSMKITILNQDGILI